MIAPESGSRSGTRGGTRLAPESPDPTRPDPTHLLVVPLREKCASTSLRSMDHPFPDRSVTQRARSETMGVGGC